ncbi:MAG: hypothetical protein K0U41_01015 [Gammaproteobacteria bacterium]|nr:hypothetical protein [Gammaproteobacteria bacterium]
MALQKINPEEIKRMVSLADPAIDVEAMGAEGLKDYIKEYDYNKLIIKEGQHPTIFLVKNIGAQEEARIKQDHQRIEYPGAKELKGKKKPTMDDLKPKIKQINQKEMIIKYFDAACSQYEEEGKVYSCTSKDFPLRIVEEIGNYITLRSAFGDDLKNVL